MMAVDWYEVRPGRSTMVEFSDGDVKVLKSGTVFQESPKNKSVIRLQRGNRPRLRKLEAPEIAYRGLDELDDIIVVSNEE